MKTAVATAIALAATVLTLAWAPAAHAEAGPSITFPLYRPAGAPADGEAIIQLEAPPRAWGIRQSARLMDEQVPGLTIHTTGTCAANPTAVCVRVEIGSYNPAQQMTLGGVPSWRGICYCEAVGTRTIYLNRWRKANWLLPRDDKIAAAQHEFGHALGLGHHDSEGVMSWDHVDGGGLSVGEAAVLTEWFSVPRYRPVA